MSDESRQPVPPQGVPAGDGPALPQQPLTPPLPPQPMAPQPVGQPVPPQPMAPQPVGQPVPPQPMAPQPVAQPVPPQPMAPQPVGQPVPPQPTAQAPHQPQAPQAPVAAHPGGDAPQAPIGGDAGGPGAPTPPPAPSGGGGGNRPSPLLLGLLAAVVIGGGVYKFVLSNDDAEPVSTPAPAMTTPAGSTPAGSTPQATGAVAAIPKKLPAGDADVLALDAREVAPKRFANQVKLVRKELKPGEQLAILRVQNDGSIVALATADGAGRWVTSKKDLSPQPVPAGQALTSLTPLDASDINDRVPAKFLRVAAKAKGVAPSQLVLSHPAAGVYGNAATWTLTWAAAPGTPAVTLFANAKGGALTK